MTPEPTGERLSAAYWRLWTASTISNLGDGVFLVALPLLAAHLTSSKVAISLVAAAASLPWLLLSLPIGAIIDRTDRRRVLIAADTFRAVLVGTLAALVAADAVHIWMLWVAALALGVAEVFFDNSSQALVPAVVPAHLLERANGRRYAAEIAANTFIGTPLGSVFFSIAIWLPFGVDAASFALAVLLVVSIGGRFHASRAVGPQTATVEPVEPADSAGTTLRHETIEGLRWLWKFPLMRSLAVALGLSNLGFAVSEAVFVLFAREELGISDRSYGFLLGVMGVGAVVGAMLGERIGKLLGQAGAIYTALVIWALTLVLTGLFPVTWFVASLAAIVSMAASTWNVITVSLRQQVIPPELFGRVNSVYRWFGWGTIPIGAVLGGQVATHFGLRSTYFVGGAFVVLAILVLLPHLDQRKIDAVLAEADHIPA